MKKVDLKKRILKAHQNLPKDLQDAPIILAISGGMDSSVLADVAVALRSHLPPLHLAHVNYHLRVPDSDLEEALIAKLAKKNNIPFFCKRLQPKNQNKNVQSWARDERLKFFHQIVEKKLKGRGVVWLAHHQRDQVETILIKILRGGSIRSLGGMEGLERLSLLENRRLRSPLVLFRPLLDINYEAIGLYAKIKKISFLEDASNQKDVYLRNRIRHQWLPLLIEENPKAMDLIENLGQRLRQAGEALEVQGKFYLKKHLIRGTKFCKLETNKLRELPIGLQEAVMKEFLSAAGGQWQSLGKWLPRVMSFIQNPCKSHHLKLKNGLKLYLYRDYIEINFKD